MKLAWEEKIANFLLQTALNFYILVLIITILFAYTQVH